MATVCRGDSPYVITTSHCAVSGVPRIGSVTLCSTLARGVRAFSSRAAIRSMVLQRGSSAPAARRLGPRDIADAPCGRRESFLEEKHRPRLEAATTPVHRRLAPELWKHR